MTIITADWLIADPGEPPLQHAAVRVLGSEIIDVGEVNALRQQFPDDDVVDGTGHVLAPGFVNTHAHLYGVLAHGIPLPQAPSGFWPFLEDFWWPRVEDALDHDMI
ncbi:MAG: amidohydrolase, partial [Ilumatobacteraceae bacterium]